MKCENDEVLGNIENDINSFTKFYNSKDGLVLRQNLNKTDFIYKGKVLKTWSHTVEKSFLFGNECEALKNYVYISNENRQEKWENLGLLKQKECLKEYYGNDISIEKIDDRFYKIIQTGYEWLNIFIFDEKNNKVLNGEFGDTLTKIEQGKSGTYIMYSKRGGSGGLNFINNTGSVYKIFENTCDTIYNTYPNKTKCITINNFELMYNKKIKIFYTNGLNEKKEIIKIIGE
ncbi:MAG: hypothetical protein Q9M97_08030 [Candidatus Gracilibacteria bacterium]|nr:hypothetical protein [Candidatus Gracilibacteria bacterium]